MALVAPSSAAPSSVKMAFVAAAVAVAAPSSVKLAFVAAFVVIVVVVVVVVVVVGKINALGTSIVEIENIEIELEIEQGKEETASESWMVYNKEPLFSFLFFLLFYY